MKDNFPRKAVLAAITAAVTSHIKTEESSLSMLATLPVVVPISAPAGSFYGAYGRQQMMEMRRLLSLRLLR